jgi:hypothetical protein
MREFNRLGASFFTSIPSKLSLMRHQFQNQPTHSIRSDLFMRKRVWSPHTTRMHSLLSGSGKMLRRSLLSSSVRSFSANARYELPPFAGEPFKHYPPGSSDALSLKAELNRAKSEVVEIPCIVNGKEYFTGDIQEQVCPFTTFVSLPCCSSLHTGDAK